MREILINVYISDIYCKIIGEEYTGDEPPKSIFLSMPFEPRKEIKENNLVKYIAEIPKDFLYKQIRNIVYSFIYDINLFQAESKYIHEQFKANELTNYIHLKEYIVQLPISKSEKTLYDIKEELNNISEVILKDIKVPIITKKSNDIDFNLYNENIEKYNIPFSLNMIKKDDSILDVDLYLSKVKHDTLKDKIEIEKEILKIYDITKETEGKELTREEILKGMLEDV